MSVMVRFGNRKAFLREGAWTSSDVELERRLNTATSDWFRKEGGPGFSDPQMELSVAREMAERYQGKVALHVKTGSGRSNEPFLRHRQLEFDFSGFIPGNSRRSSR
ncbi:MAG: hypothetical protein FJW39_06030 [Acidobacteria bacterium]|nr:hypothetical protein [Acidobacteriota bacterium]